MSTARLTAALADRYAIEDEIDSGGMATVYRARDLKHDRTVAIKVLRPDLAQAIGAGRFFREIRTTANLSHPHILPLHDSGEADGFLFYVMPFVKGESLRDRMEREGHLPVEAAVQISREVADALAYAHREGVIHRDVKPANILLDEGHALLADFGIAQARAGAEETRLTGSGMSLGTPSYMSPEQISGDKEVDGRADQYALGCVLYEMLAGHPPFTGADIQTVMRKHLAVDPAPVTEARASVPAGVAEAVSRAMSKTPADRFPTTEAFHNAIKGRDDSAPAAVGSSRKTRSVVIPGLAAVALVTLFLLGRAWGWSGSAGPPSEDRPFTVLVAVEGSAEPNARGSVAYILQTELNRGHAVQTPPADEVARMRMLMDLPDTAVLDRARARDLATRLGASTVTVPRLDEIDGTFAFSLRVEDRTTGTQRAGITERAASGADLVKVVTDGVLEIQEALGENSSVLAATRRFPDVVTPSIEALELYLEGRNLVLQGLPRRAIPSLRDAVTRDSAFAMAWHMLSIAYAEAGLPDSADAAAARRDRHSERLSDARQADVEFRETRARDIAHWDQAYERFEQNVVRLAGRGERETYVSNYALALTEISWMDSAYATSLQGHTRHVADLRARYPSLDLEYVCFQRDFVNSTTAAAVRGEMEEYLAFMDSLELVIYPVCRSWAEFVSSIAAGEWNRADDLFGPVMDTVAAYPILANLQTVGDGLIFQLDAVRGRIVEQHRVRTERGGGRDALILEVVYGLPPSVEEGAGAEPAGRGMAAVFDFTLHGTRAALLGDTLESAYVLRRLEAMRDSATSNRFERAFAPWFTLMEAGPAFQARDWPRLIQVLEPLEAAFREPGYGIARGDTYLVWWLLSLAYEGVGRKEDAITCLEDIVGLPRYRGADVDILGLAYPAAQLKLGRLYHESGDTTQAVEHFRTFLSIFTDPEPEFDWMVEGAREALNALGLSEDRGQGAR